MGDAQWPQPMNFSWCDCCEMPTLSRGQCWECRDVKQTKIITNIRTIHAPGKSLIQGEFIEKLPDGRIVIKVDGKRVTGRPVEKE